jgi:hypothetical protein
MLAWGGAVELWRSARGRERAPSCGTRDACRRALRWSWLGLEDPPCPNAAFFARVHGPLR